MNWTITGRPLSGGCACDEPQARARRHDHRPWHPAFAGRIALTTLMTLAGLLLAAAPARAGEVPDWNLLRAAVVDLEVLHPGGAAPSGAVGFCVEGVPGIVTSHRLVKGAEAVMVRTASGTPARVSEYVARDADADLIVLRTAVVSPLRRGSPELLALAQVAFVLTPPSHGQPVEFVRHGREFSAPRVGALLAEERRDESLKYALTGAPLVDSLGQVVGMIEVLAEGGTMACCTVPLGNVDAMLARPDRGGTLLSLAGDAEASWLRSGTAQRAQVIGASLARIRRLEEGAHFLDQALSQDANLVEAILERGMVWQMQNDHLKAEEHYRRALALAPQSPRAHLYLGSCLFMQGFYLQAQLAYEAAIDADPRWAMPHVNLAGVLVQQGKAEDGERELRRALELDPQLGIASSNLGVLLHTRGKRVESREILEQLRALKSAYATQLHRQTIAKTAG